ncbi:MAG TPA: hypothetical protein DCP91_08650 [Eggerthellaceae bacterium]|nr:hypothetical protein [Eggerthellaceae bacterium]
MAQQFSVDWAKGVIGDNVQKAQAIIADPDQVDALLGQLHEKLRGLPNTIGTAFANVPVMAQMVKCYVTREYTEVSPKVIVSLVAAFLYFVKQKDLIPDNIPVVGLADDLAVATVAMAINEPELRAFEEWRERRGQEPMQLVEVEAEAEAIDDSDAASAIADANAAAAAVAEATAEVSAPAGQAS